MKHCCGGAGRSTTCLPTASTPPIRICWPGANVNAVTIGTPNKFHAPIVIAAARAGKHVLCEKPIALNHQEAMAMVEACRQANVCHMTAFTYRFVPAMRYTTQLVRDGAIGQVRTLRSRRLQDWGTRAIGWRQVKALAGSGEIADMMAHRLDFTQAMVGPIVRVSALVKNFIPDRTGPNGQTQVQDVHDWASLPGRVCERRGGRLREQQAVLGHRLWLE